MGETIQQQTSLDHDSPYKSWNYVPGFLARRFDWVAELEDNPIYLRSAGYRYKSGRSQLWRGLIGGLINVVIIIGALILFFLLAVFIGCCAVLLILPLVVLAQKKWKPYGLQAPGQLADYLYEEWIGGRLPHLALTHLSPWEIIWGYAGKLFIDQIRNYLWVTVTGLVTAIALITLSLIIPYTPYHIDNDEILGHFLMLGIGLLPIIPILAYHFLQISLVIYLETLESQLRKIGTRKRIPISFNLMAVFPRFFTCLRLTLPGLLVGGLAAVSFNEFFEGTAVAYNSFLVFMLVCNAFVIFYGLINIPFAVIDFRASFDVLKQGCASKLQQGIWRLMDLGEKKGSSRIFGEP